MSKHAVEKLDLPSLLGDIARDTGDLVKEQIDLFGAEVQLEVRKASMGAAEIAVGGGLAAAAGFLSGMMLAHLLQRTTRMPLWICFGLASGALSAASLKFIRDGQARIANVHLLPPPESAQALQENVEWLKQQVTNGKST